MHRHWSTYTSYSNMTEIDFQSALLMIHGLMSKVWSIQYIYIYFWIPILAPMTLFTVFTFSEPKTNISLENWLE